MAFKIYSDLFCFCINFGNFNSGEPNNHQDEDCVEIYSKDGDKFGKWNDEDCGALRNYICEITGKI